MAGRRTSGFAAASLSAVLAGLMPQGVQANPVEASPSSGTGAYSITTGAGTMDVSQTDDRVVIEWQSFDIDAGETVTFTQPDNQAIALNRVIGSGGPVSASAIDGTLNANGHVWLINPSGIAFGAGASVDVGGLLASTADINMTDAAFVATDPATGTYSFAGGAGTVSNAGTLQAGGLLAMISPFVSNTGSATSTNGDVLFGGAEAFRLSFTNVTRSGAPDELAVTDFIIDTPSSAGTGANMVSQSAAGSASGARVIASAASTGGGAILNMEGVVEAKSVGAHSGDVYLLGGADFSSGSVGATGTDVVQTDDISLTVPGTVTAQGASINIKAPASSALPASSTGAIALTAVSGDITIAPDIQAATGGLTAKAANGTISTADLTGATGVTLEAQRIDLTGTNRSITATGGAVSLTGTATGINSTGAVDIDGDSVSLTGAVSGTSVDIDADNGGVTAKNVTASSGFVSIDATGNIDVDDVSATTTARIVSSGGAVDAGNVTGPTGVTVSGTDIDLTGTGGSVQSSGGAVSLTASTGNVSSTGAMDVDGDSVTLSGAATGTSVDIDADNGGVTANDVTATGGSASIDATGDIDVDDVSATAAVRVVSSGGAVDAGDLTGPSGVTVSGTDIDLTGTGAVQSSGGTVSMTASTGDVSSPGSIDIDGDVVVISGLLTGTAIDIDADNGGVTADDMTASAGTLSVDATGAIDVDAIAGSGGVTLDSAAVDVNGTVGSSAGAVDIDGTSVTLDAAVTGNGDVTVDASSGNVTAAGTLTSSTGTVDVGAAGGNAVLAGISAGTTIGLQGNSVSTSGAVQAGGDVVVIALSGDYTASSSMNSTGGSVSATASSGDIDLAVVTANGSVTATARDLDLSGAITGGGAVNLTATAGDISSTGSVDVTGASVTTSGAVTAANDLSLTANSGDVTANDTLTATSGDLSVTASNGTADLPALAAGGAITVSARDVDLAGSVRGGGAVSLTATAGDVSTPGNMDIDGASIALSGPVNSGGNVTLDASNGAISSTGKVTASGGGMSINATSGSVTTASLDAAGAVGVTSTGSNTIIVNGDVNSPGNVSLNSVNGGVTVTGTIDAPGGTVTVSSPQGTTSLNNANAGGDFTVTGKAISLLGDIVTQGAATLKALAGDLTSSGSITVNGGGLEGSAGGTAAFRNMTVAGDLNVVAGSVDVGGVATVGGSAVLQALTGDVTVSGDLSAAGGVLLIEATEGAAIINKIASADDITLNVVDLDLTGTLSAGDQFNLTNTATGQTMVLGGDGSSGGVTLRKPQGFTIDADELTRIIANKLQIDAGDNDMVLLDAAFDPTALNELVLGADATSWIVAAGEITGLPNLQLGYVDGLDESRPELILVSGQLGADTDTGRLGAVRLESSGDIVIGTEEFLAAVQAAGEAGLDLATLGQPDLAAYNGVQGHVFIATDQLRLYAPGEIVQLNTGTGAEGAGVVFGEAVTGEGTIENAVVGPERVNLFGVVIRADGTRVVSFEAGLEPNLLEPGLEQNGELRLNLCVIGDSSTCSNAILREAQETADARTSALSAITNTAIFSFECASGGEESGTGCGGGGLQEDAGGVAGAGNEGLWGVGVP